ncbi:MAG: spermine synthase [Anaerolineae bacterium]
MKNRVAVAIAIMGFSGFVAEILLLREFLIVFAGNEFAIGIVLANWLIIEACGSFYLGRAIEKSPRKLEAFALVTVLFCASLPAAIFLIRLLKRLIGVSIGENLGLWPMFYSSFLILLPISLLHGALFTFSCEIYATCARRDASVAGTVYAWETVGTVIGGVACTYLLIPYLDTFQAAAGIAALNIAACLLLLVPTWKARMSPKAIAAIVVACALASLLLVSQAHRLHLFSIAEQWKGQNVVHYQNSLYGNICVVHNEGQFIFFQDGAPNVITPIPDIPFVERFVHLPLLAHAHPTQVLILSGGAGGVINEALKHPPVETIEYAELDPLLIDLLRKFHTPLTEAELTDPRVTIRHVDGRLLLKTTPNRYDVIFVGIMEPSSLQTNRFFTGEFFALARNRLNDGGILVLGLPGSLTYLSDELKDLNSSIFHTLKSVFPHVRMIPGDGVNLFLASDAGDVSALDKTQIIERMQRRNIATHLTVPWYIEQALHPGWQAWFMRFIEGGSRRINTDFSPIGVFYTIAHWNAVFAPALREPFRRLGRLNLTMIVVLAGALLLLWLIVRLRGARFPQIGIPLSIATTGFAGMMFDLMLAFAFQAMYGYMFSWIGMLAAAFMTGAACGAMLSAQALNRLKDCFGCFRAIELAIMGFAVGCPLVLLAVNARPGNGDAFSLHGWLFLILSFGGGLLTGAQFPPANRMYWRTQGATLSGTAGLLYASDLLGGWLGGMLGAVVLLPVLGFVGACAVVGLLKLVSFVVVSTSGDLDR